MAEELETKMTNQSFMEAGGGEEFPELEIAGVVLAKQDKGERSGHMWNLSRVTKELDHRATHLGATHIFKVEYLMRPDEHKGEVLYGAVGTAYKPRTQ